MIVRLCATLVSIVSCAFVYAQDDYSIIVSKKDGSNIYYPIEDVDAISFLQTNAIPEGYIPSEKVICVDEYGIPITPKKKIVLSWGDSLTQGAGGNGVTYPIVLQNLLGDEYEVLNAGVGGEKTYTIAARQGGAPMLLGEDVDIPNASEYVQVTLFDNYGNGLNIRKHNQTINPCHVNGKRCELKVEKKDDASFAYYITSLEDRIEGVKKYTPIVTNYMRLYRTPYIMIIWIGQNGDYSSPNDLADQIQRMIDYAGIDRYLIIGLHMKNNIICNPILSNRFGNKFIDWGSYASTLGLQDAGLVANEQDIQDMNNGICPMSLKSDNVHLN